MDPTIAEAIAQGGVVDITTTGRRTDAPRRIEIYFHHLDGDLYITGRPGFPRDWLANLTADPRFVLHLKRGVTADLDAVAEIITDQETRSDVLYRILTESWGNPPEKARADLPVWVAEAPLIRFRLDAVPR
jgi:hypothetical protein